MSAGLAALGLSRSFGAELAVDHVDLTVESGQIHAIVGLNGAGKTTLMRLMLGMLAPDSGQALVLDTDARDAPRELWRSVGHMIETPFAYPELTVRENLRSSGLLQGMSRRDAAVAAERVIDEFELGQWANSKARTLSMGNRQRLGLAGAVIHEPKILVLDEPANSLDPAGVVFTRQLLETRAAAGAAVLVSSHHFDQLARIADVITVIHRGRVVGTLEPTGTDLEQAFFEMVHEWDLAEGATT